MVRADLKSVQIFKTLVMMRYDPSLFLSRLVVTQRGGISYDQRFHLGVNVIRGANSHGKSTIAEFIFFVLGGDISRWKPEASSCDQVWAEVLINGATVVLRRPITDKRGQQMDVFFGSYEEASLSAVEGWRTYPYKRTSTIESFSEVLFTALGMPETQGEASSHITMHQLLRLIYIDQITPPDALMRMEEFDSPLTRRIVLEYLLGAYDDRLYQDQLECRSAKRRLEAMQEQLRQLETVLDRAEIDTDPNTFQGRIEDAKKELEALEQRIATLRTEQNETQVKKHDGIAPLVKRVADKRSERYQLSNKTRDLLIELEDSAQFISALETRIIALDDAATARSALGAMALGFCPQCLSPLADHIGVDSCLLCKQPSSEEITRTHAARMRQELELQIRESKVLFERKQNEYNEKKALLEKVEAETKLAQHNYEQLIAIVQTSRDESIDLLLIEKGGLERAIEDLLQKRKIVQVLLNIRKDEADLKGHVQRLEISIRRRESDQEANLAKALDVVQKFTIGLLGNDLQLEEGFGSATSIILKPESNSFAVDERNQFSASSMIYLKNSIHFALLFASLKLPNMRYPRLVVCDNIEDKGMTVDRSRNFQRNILKLSEETKVEHQIIFTTSMVDPSLDNGDFAVGPNYVDGVKTLRVASGEARS